MSSLGGWIPSRTLFMTPYTTSKIALRALGISLRETLREEGIGVTTICPGFTESRMVTLQESQGITRAGLLPMGVTSIESATEKMVSAIERDAPEVAWPSAYYTVIRVFAAMPIWVGELFGFLMRTFDPYHGFDLEMRRKSFGSSSSRGREGEESSTHSRATTTSSTSSNKDVTTTTRKNTTGKGRGKGSNKKQQRFSLSV